MLGFSSGRLLAGISERTLELAGTSPTSALVGAVVAYVGVRILRRTRRDAA